MPLLWSPPPILRKTAFVKSQTEKLPPIQSSVRLNINSNE